jgi:hypothetical protein
MKKKKQVAGQAQIHVRLPVALIKKLRVQADLEKRTLQAQVECLLESALTAGERV